MTVPAVPPNPADPTDANALLAQIADIGRDPVRGGYSRHVFDPAELELRAWFQAKAAALDLNLVTDGNTVMWAWWGEPAEGAIGVGSHLDSVPGGGAFDGPLGVASALAVVARWRATGYTPARPFAIVVFPEEEGSRFGLACLGSRLAAGAADPFAARQLKDRDGVTLADAAAAAGFDPAGFGVAGSPLSHLSAFVELHVEQGRGLEDLGQPVAIASAIIPHGRWRLEFEGESNHAGTTLMADRHDPVVAAAHAVLAVRQMAEAAPGARGTVGRLEVIPGGTNVIAGRCTLWLDVRAEAADQVQQVVGGIEQAAAAAAQAEGCAFRLTEESDTAAVQFDPALADRLAAVLPKAPRLSTGAGHDAGVLAAVLPTAMLFVRNPTGLSHGPSEHSRPADVEAGVAALDAVLRSLTAG
ncbi:MAG: allantoate amidohydrolase [Bifidobacteriaceae bacterium]|jgi:N-carbamoyl-L-amino-acid hydrolase|nr:allantoate amidohydrolase [Bifidobacteriaceae bacterium]